MTYISTSHDTTQRSASIGNASDLEYCAFVARVQARLNATKGSPLFTTDADVWDAYIGSFPLETRQFHTCHACRHFLERFGGLATIDENGAARPALWSVDDANPDEAGAVDSMSRAVRRAKVTGVFLSSDKLWGTPFSRTMRNGTWAHLALTPPASIVYKHAVNTAAQAMAAKVEDHKNVMRALGEFKLDALKQALTILSADALYQSEKVLGPIQWLHDLQEASTEHKHARSNLVWRAIASAPAGFCHPRSSMAGTLLEDIAAGMSFAEVSRRFAAKMHPLQYQRPQAPPTAGAIAAAQKLVAELGVAGSLARRYARLDEVEALWRPAGPEHVHVPTGMFGHLVPKNAKPAAQMRVPPQTMTWEKFARTVLPTAQAIDLRVEPVSNSYAALVTAENIDAPPILQWDLAARRNPVSWYLYNGGSTPQRWNLTSPWARVTAVALKPSMWHGDFKHHGQGAMFLLEVARDTAYKNAGLALFPSILKSEFHGIRSTIEAHSRSGVIGGYCQSSACGLMFDSGGRGAHLRVTVGGQQLKYKLDRWD